MLLSFYGLIFLACVLMSREISGQGGGYFSDTKTAGEDQQAIIDQVKDAAASQLKLTSGFSKYVAISYRSQVVAGMVYVVKVQVGDSQYIHERIFVPLAYTGQPPSLQGVISGVGVDTPLDYDGFF